MTDISPEQLEEALAQHASATGEVYPNAFKLIEAEGQWTGRLWEVTKVLMADHSTMRYVAGGNRAAEVADCAVRWAQSPLRLDQIALIFSCGGYDPDPFVPLARWGLLRSALCLADGTPRTIKGERSGAWISDELALATDDEIIARCISPAEVPAH